MTWSGRRRLVIVSILALCAAIVLFLYFYPIVFKAPSCTDGRQDGTETGVDCGGGCVNFCANEIKSPVVLWSRSFPVTSSVYNAVAYIENDNNAAVESLPYEFRLYDAQNTFVARVDGTAIIPPLGRYAIVETGIKVGNAVVAHTIFAFGQSASPWMHVPAAIQSLQAPITNVALTDLTTIPKLSATLTNPSATTDLNNTVVAAVLYDANDNAINVSKTFVPTLKADSSAQIFFTWQGPLSAPVVRYDIIPIIDIFHTTK